MANDLQAYHEQPVALRSGTGLASAGGAAAQASSQEQAIVAFLANGAREKRDLRAVMEEIKVIAEHSDQPMTYEIPVKNKDGTKSTIGGPSIHAANIVATTMPNIMTSVYVVDNGADWIIYATVADSEKGNAIRRAFSQRKDQRTMGDAQRQKDIAFAIGQSKAIRNVLVNGYRWAIDVAVKAQQTSMVKKIKEHPQKYREAILKSAKARSVSLDRLCDVVDGVLPESWDPDEMQTLIRAFQAITDGQVSVDEAFPPLAPASAPSAPVTSAPAAPDSSPSSLVDSVHEQPEKEPAKKTVAKKPAEAATPKATPKAKLLAAIKAAKDQGELDDAWANNNGDELADDETSEAYNKRSEEVA